MLQKLGWTVCDFVDTPIECTFHEFLGPGAITPRVQTVRVLTTPYPIKEIPSEGLLFLVSQHRIPNPGCILVARLGHWILWQAVDPHLAILI
jgi:hypothetical protein